MEWCEYTAHELAEMYRSKKVTVREVVESVYRKIEEREGVVKAYISLQKEEALKQADEIQKAFDNGEELPLLAGIPVAVKDNICTKGVATTCASKMLENFVPPFDATVMDKLHENRCIVIGKTNLDEFAMGGSTENSAFCKTTNPHNAECVPGGSSGGSAAAVSADEAIFSLGSDTGGSIRQPSSFCGVVGLKPTYGTVSRYGLIAFASSLDQIGPITKDVTDAALVMNVISGRDEKDSTSVELEKKDYTKALVKDVKGLKIGLPKEFFGEGIHEEVKSVVMAAVKELEAKGAIVEEFSMPVIEHALPIYYILSSAEASSNLSRFDGIKYGYRSPNAKNLNEIYEMSRSEGFGPEVKRRIMLGTYVLSSGYYDAYYHKALKARTLVRDEFNKAFEKYDVIIGPTAPMTAFKIGEKSGNPVEMYLADICTVPVNIAGVPAISVPVGFDKNKMPVGMQIIGNIFEEEKILRVAYNTEK
ncbi:MAG: Asp-tRNA(Asn)/Glu-tRNA(Gln) amidotransferase subunit GatA [Clostridia bacterium]|nr:Asp-tRNA(Asn)/Glu-tRNA(Gln) amidotransferase subunit GatA [Clostridia bacterium]